MKNSTNPKRFRKAAKPVKFILGAPTATGQMPNNEGIQVYESVRCNNKRAPMAKPFSRNSAKVSCASVIG